MRLVELEENDGINILVTENKTTHRIKLTRDEAWELSNMIRGLLVKSDGQPDNLNIIKK